MPHGLNGPAGSALSRSRGLDAGLLAFTVVVFAVDVYTPLGLTFWVFHLVPLCFAMFTWRPSLPLIIAALAGMFVVAGYFLSPPGISPSLSQINRTIGVLVFAITAFAGRRHILAKIALSEEEWIQRGETELSARLQGELTAAEIAGRALEMLVAYLGASIGAAWILTGDRLVRVASHALSVNSPEHLTLGEGLVGQTAKDGRLRSLADVPHDYLVTRSSIGERAPLHLVLWPTRAEGVVHGVLEFGFFRRISPAVVTLLERASESVAVALRSAVYRQHQQELLQETQLQAEELQSQQEELRVINEELEQQGSALRETQQQQQQAQIELEEANANLEQQTASLEQQRDDLARAQRELTVTATDLAKASTSPSSSPTCRTSCARRSTARSSSPSCSPTTPRAT